ncbi:hypothetical protein SEVIR_8G148100v4 [Setaria viridis]|uniref:Uncharacterized protein n=1 Tax=Setaria viridis TaxID=4556 RepID=A0A4U6TFG0_SETVI|nr:uncharacterized protein LOC117834144 [Setaria viridis]TKW00980.1 hypothetical protein SEVIR_8G148100v2 [Setaria viridis]
MEVLEVSSLASLEEEIDLWSGGQRPLVLVLVPRVGDLFEAAPLLDLLKKQVYDSRFLWKVDDGALALLLQASEYYQKLDLLELHLDLMRLDIVEGISMKKIRFDGVRQTANEVVIHAHPASMIEVLDSITIEGQRIARVANLLGFGGAGVEETKLMDDDLEWLLEDVFEAGEVGDVEAVYFEEDMVSVEDREAGLPVGSGDEGALSNRLDALHLGVDQRGVFYPVVGKGKILTGLADQDNALHLASGLEAGEHNLGDDIGQVNPVAKDGAHHLGHINSKINPEAKEDAIKGVLLQKISRLQLVLQRVKRGPFFV